TRATNSTPPAATDDVCIDTPFAGTTVTLANSQQTVHNLVAASTVQIGGLSPTALTINGTSASNFANNLIISGAPLTVTPGVAINGTLTSTGNSSIGGTASAIVANGGLTINGGQLTLTGNLVSFGASLLESGANLQLNQGAAFDNRSTLTVSGNSAILTSSSSSVINRAGATINVVA